MSQTKVQLVNDVIGNSGFGDDSPDRELVVKKASSNSSIKIEASNAHTSQLFFSDTDTENVARISVFHGSGADQNSLLFGTAGTARLAITSAGKVGINTISPVGKLTVDENNASEHFQLRNTTNTSNFTAFGVDTSFNLRLYVNQNERRRVLSTGKFLFNRTTEFTTSPSGGDAVDYQFEQLTSDGYTLGVHCDQTLQRGMAIYYTPSKTPEPAFIFKVGTSFKTIIRADGDLENANNSYGSISDVSMKENIVDANSQWNDIKNIKIRNYNFKESTGQQTHTQIGVIAQELETVSPKLVRESEDGMKTVSYSLLYMKAVKALQEAQTRIETLETEVAALKAA